MEISVSRYYSCCHEIETLEHLLFKCETIHHVWGNVGHVVRVNMQSKQLIIGLEEKYSEIFNKAKNMIITITIYSIFTGSVKCGNSKESFKYINTWNNLISKLNLYSEIYSKYAHKQVWYSTFHKLVGKYKSKLISTVLS